MNRIFADSSAIIAFCCRKDHNHQSAKACVEMLRRENRLLVTTDYVFDESITGILSNAGHLHASMAGESILESTIISLVWLDQEAKVRAWEYFRKHSDKGYSFTDCTSFVFMKEMGLTCCLSFDRHFEQAGFRLLMRWMSSRSI